MQNLHLAPLQRDQQQNIYSLEQSNLVDAKLDTYTHRIHQE
jgi:hypothetical protein